MTKQEAIEQFKDYENSGWSKSITPSSEALGMAIEALEQQEYIVHCKDCRLMVDDGHCKLHSYGVDWILYPYADMDFCSWGEKKELS